MITQLEKLRRYCDANFCDTEDEMRQLLSEWGTSRWELSKAEIEMLLSGRILVLDDGEYTHVVKLREEDAT